MMLTPDKSDDLSTTHYVAINKIHPQLLKVLRSQHTEFEAELNSILEGSYDQVYSLLDQYPAAQQQLIDALLQQGVVVTREEARERIMFSLFGSGLYGEGFTLPQTSPQTGRGPVHFAIIYWCKTDNHIVTDVEVEEKNLDGVPLCPKDHEPMTDLLPSSFSCQTHNNTVALTEVREKNLWDSNGHPLCPTDSTTLLIEDQERVD